MLNRASAENMCGACQKLCSQLQFTYLLYAHIYIEQTIAKRFPEKKNWVFHIHVMYDCHKYYVFPCSVAIRSAATAMQTYYNESAQVFCGNDLMLWDLTPTHIIIFFFSLVLYSCRLLGCHQIPTLYGTQLKHYYFEIIAEQLKLSRLIGRLIDCHVKWSILHKTLNYANASNAGLVDEKEFRDGENRTYLVRYTGSK